MELHGDDDGDSPLRPALGLDRGSGKMWQDAVEKVYIYIPIAIAIQI